MNKAQHHEGLQGFVKPRYDFISPYKKRPMKTKLWTLSTLFLLATVLTTYQRPLAAQSPSANPPVTTIPLKQEGITIRLINQAVAPITYEALGDTQPRILQTGSDVLLQNLNTPATLTFFYKDIQKNRQIGEGLLQAALRVDDATGVLDIVIRPTISLEADVSNITIEPNGNVFVF